jgi:RNA polymerase sigma-70 factor, ECF subfamily
MGRCAIRERDLAWRPPMRRSQIFNDEEALLEAARSGDADAFEQLVAEHRRSLHAHSYRMLGSRHDADDALQEALFRAWRAIPRFEGRSSVRSWLYRIATNASLDLIVRRRRRGAGRFTEVPLTDETGPEPPPDDRLTPEAGSGSPEASYERREAAELAFSTALEHIPHRSRQALILREVLGFTAREAAEVLGSSPAAVNSALYRARAVLERRRLEPTVQATGRASGETQLADTVERFVDALERNDLGAIVESLRSPAGR